MKSISVSELRSHSGRVWRELRKTGELVVTFNRKPIGVLHPVTAETLEETLRIARQARAARAIDAMQKRSVLLGNDKLTLAEINVEIAAARKARRK